MKDSATPLLAAMSHLDATQFNDPAAITTSDAMPFRELL